MFFTQLWIFRIIKDFPLFLIYCFVLTWDFGKATGSKNQKIRIWSWRSALNNFWRKSRQNIFFRSRSIFFFFFFCDQNFSKNLKFFQNLKISFFSKISKFFQNLQISFFSKNLFFFPFCGDMWKISNINTQWLKPHLTDTYPKRAQNLK